MPTFPRAHSFLAVAAASAACLLLATPACAAIGNWNGNRGCPVDAPAMLASPGGSYTACAAFFGGGPWKLGNLALRGGLDGDFGVHGPSANDGDLSLVPGPRMYPHTGSVDGVYLNSPISGLCPALPGSRPYDPNSPYAFCLALARGTDPNRLFTPYFESAGNPSDFRLSGAIGTGPVISIPVKVRLASPALGSTCYIGSDLQPIVVRLNSAVPPGTHYTSPDPNGFAVTYDGYSGGQLDDTSFAVPRARGCGSPAMDAVLNGAFGLPSPSGENSFTTYREFSVQSTAAGGGELSQAYHAALDP